MAKKSKKDLEDMDLDSAYEQVVEDNKEVDEVPLAKQEVKKDLKKEEKQTHPKYDKFKGDK